MPVSDSSDPPRHRRRSPRPDSHHKEHRPPPRSRSQDGQKVRPSSRSPSPPRDNGHDRRHKRSRTDERGERNHPRSEGRSHQRRDRSRHRARSRSRSRSPFQSRRARSRSRSPRKPHRKRSRERREKRPKPGRRPSPHSRARKPLPSQEMSFRREQDPGLDGDGDGDEGEVEKERVNFSSTGLLAAEANRVAGTDVVLKYHEPADARLPPASQDWRLYVFKGEELLDTVPLYSRTCWLLGREEAVADLPVGHPSASKQHAVVQFRYVTKVGEFGDKVGRVKPYLVDLESSNGTRLNGDQIGKSRYVEVRTGDVMKIGMSDREYVFMLPPKA